MVMVMEHKLMVVPLVPAQLVEVAWRVPLDDEIQELPARLAPQVAQLKDYLRRQWPQVMAEALSVHDEERRTNNDAEAFFSVFGLSFRERHPNLWRLVAKISEAIGRTDRDVGSLRLGVPQERCSRQERLRRQLGTVP